MASYRLRTLGGLSIDGPGADALSGHRKHLVLLAILATAGPRGIGRDRLMALLWPESDAERARGALKQAVHAIRRQLGAPDAVTGVAELRLDPAVIDSDWMSFQQALARGDDAAAVQSYTGPFLDGTYSDGSPELERWIEEERARLAHRVGEAIERLAERAEASGNAREAAHRWRQRHEGNPLDSRISLRLMRALVADGDRAGAVQHARAHEALMRSELDLSPDPAVIALARELQETGTGLPAPRTPEAGTSAAAARGSVTAVPPPPGPAPALRWWRSLVPVVAAGAVAVAAYAVRTRGGDAAPVALVPNRVAVAVFVNRTGSRELDALGTMAADWVTRGLARTSLAEVFDVGGLYIDGRSSEGVPTDARALARANGAGIVVAGNYYRDGSKLMFSVQLVDVSTGRLLRSLDPIPADAGAPLAGVEEIRQRVAAALGTVLDPRVSATSTPAMVPPRFDAYTEYAAGQEVYWRGDWERALPHFRRAAQLDTNFTTAIAFLGVVGVGTGRCDLTDSVERVLATRREVAPFDLLTARISTARCASDHETHNRLHRERGALMPGSRQVRMVLSTGYRQLNQPATALAVLAEIRPERDLGWIPVRGRAFYWREVAANEHALRDYRAERRTADRMRRMDVSRLATGFVRARSLAALGYADSALAALDSVAGEPPEPPLVAGIIGRLDPVGVATPGWVMWQVALELATHGNPRAAQAAADRAERWFAARDTTPQLATRLVHAQVLEYLGRLDDSRRLLDGLRELDSTSVDVQGTLGVVAARQGDTRESARAERWLSADRGFPPGLPRLYRARMAAVRGDTVAAGALLDSLPHQVHPTDLLQFHLDPALAMLRESGRLRRWVVPRAG